MNTLQDSKRKHKRGRNFDYPVSPAVKQQTTSFPNPELFLALLWNFQQYQVVKNIEAPLNSFAA